MPTTGKTSDMYEDAGQVYTDMISLADYFGCPVVSFAQPQRHAWDKANNGELIYSHEMAHSAKKAHKCSSVSSLNFAEGQENGILYVDIVRRGESAVKVGIKRELGRGLIMESSDIKALENME